MEIDWFPPRHLDGGAPVRRVQEDAASFLRMTLETLLIPFIAFRFQSHELTEKLSGLAMQVLIQ